MARLGEQVEDWVADLFRELGYRVRQDVLIGGLRVDLVIERDDVRSPVEVLWYSQRVPLGALKDKILRFHHLAAVEGYVSPLVVVVGQLTAEATHFALTSFGARVWDLSILREKAKPYPELARRLESFVSGERRENRQSNDAVDDRRAPAVEQKQELNRLIKRLKHHEVYGGLSPNQYEELCQEVMIFLFDPHLYGFEKQARTSDGANRYDFICRIKPGNPFWDSMRSDFRTRSILFECKNYNEPITADQVYSTERYLFSGALRTVCLLISRKGPDDGCKRAAQGALRESGKLILLLSNADLIEMLRLRADKEGPTSCLDEKIWKFIITLPR